LTVFHPANEPGPNPDADGYRVVASTDGTDFAVKADAVVHAAGRAPSFEQMNLKAAGIATDHGRLQLNEFLQSVTNPAVYAAGDAAQAGPPLTPVSSHDAKVVSANILSGNHQTANYKGVPSVAFTIPPIAAVGLTEAHARKNRLRFRMQSHFVPSGSPHVSRLKKCMDSRYWLKKVRIWFSVRIWLARTSMKSSMSLLWPSVTG
jgi:glutathione reductase (NADPH)